MIKILIAIKNERIFKELKNIKKVKIISNNLQYREGILETLENNPRTNYIILNEDLYGQIKIEELISKIKEINNKIKIIIILTKKDLTKEEYLLKNKIKFIYEKGISTQKILETLLDKKKTVGILGSKGCGKTVTTLILSEVIAKHKNKKILIVEDTIENNSIVEIYKLKNKEKQTDTRRKEIKIKNNMFLLSVKEITGYYKKNGTKIINEINKIKNEYDYVFIDLQNINSYKTYKEIMEETLLILNPNILEINKIKKFIIKNKTEIKLLLNDCNENSISEEILKKLFKNKIEIIGKIENNPKYNLVINNNFNIEFIDKKSRKNFLRIINNI